MRPRILTSTLAALAWLSAPCLAQGVSAPVAAENLVETNAQASDEADDADDIVRLPGQGHLKPDAPHGRHASGRLVPGGGLIVSFDANDDGKITPDELKTGAAAAFALADANKDGSLSALEQQDWANSLPTRDDTLANPVRFDPNLDRMASQAEFIAVVGQLAADHTGSDGNIHVSDLAAPERDKEDKKQLTDLIEPDQFARR